MSGAHEDETSDVGLRLAGESGGEHGAAGVAGEVPAGLGVGFQDGRDAVEEFGDLRFQEGRAEGEAHEVGRVADGGEIFEQRRVGVRIHHAAGEEDDAGGAA